jgi:hypothetical protein
MLLIFIAMSVADNPNNLIKSDDCKEDLKQELGGGHWSGGRRWVGPASHR